MATVDIIPIPLGSQFVKTIGANDPDSLNDFPVLLVFSENASDLTESSITLSGGATLVSLEGQNSVRKAVIRPPQTAGIVTVTIAANAVAEGNPETRKEIRVSTSFPDADAATPRLLWDHNLTRPSYSGIAVTSNIISIFGYTYGGNQRSSFQVNQFTHDGTAIGQLTSGTSFTISTFYSGLIPLNGTFFFISRYSSGSQIHEVSPDGTITSISGGGTVSGSVTRIPDGIKVGGRRFSFIDETLTDITVENQRTSESGIDYNNVFYDGTGFFWVKDSTNIQRISYANIDHDAFSVYRDTLYSVDADGVYSLDIRPYRPMALNTKRNIPVVFADEGRTVDLTQFAPDAKRIVFDVGYDKPPYLSINSSNELVITSNAVTETSPVLVKLKAINYIDATEDESFQFYLVIQQAQRPIVRNVSELTMRAHSSYNLFDLVPDADLMSFRSGRTQLAGSSLSNGLLTIGTEGGTAHFTARRGSRSSHFQINIHVVQESSPANFSDKFRHKVLIAGIDVSADISQFPSVSASIDAILLNEYRANETTLSLKSNNTNNFRYNDDIPDNFWQTNTLNPAGFNERIEIFIESLVDGSYKSHLLFSGVIVRSVANISNAAVQLQCVDTTTELRNTRVQDFGTLQKWSVLRQQSDEASFEGIYVPDNSLLPMQVGTGKAWHDRTKLTIRDLRLPSEGKPLADTAYMTDSDLRTSGGFLDNPPLMRFMGQHRSEDVRFLVNQIALNKNIYNAEIDLPPAELENPFILNRGSVAFSVENTRIQRLLTDWVYDSTNDRILMLLSNPEAHIADLLVQYNLSSDAYRVLYTFDKDIKVHRIARRNSTNYYILSSNAISQDRSASALPRRIDSTAYAYDSVAKGSKIRIHHYNAATHTLSEHVDENDSRPPQLGIHYWVGFKNPLHIDEFEGIVPYYRGTLKVHNSNLYYRYATATEFGIARVDASRTTTALITQDGGALFNHLNFAFDLAPNGDLYFAYRHYDDVRSTEVRVIDNIDRGQDLTIANDLSGYIAPLPLMVSVGIVGFGGYFYTVIITGTNGLGETISETISGSGSRGFTDAARRIHTIDTGFQTIIRVDFSGSSVRGLIITAAPGNISNLVIKKRTAGGAVSTILVYAPDLDTNDGFYLGCYEALFHDNNLYMLCPVGRVDVDGSDTTLSVTKAAGMILCRCDVTGANPSLTVLETYDFVQRGACNLTVYEGAVHFVESPPALTQFKPINPDLDGYWTDAAQTQTMGYNLLPETLGVLKKVTSTGEIESLGNLYHTDRPYNVAAARCLSVGGDLHITMGYGNLDELLRFNSLASEPENVQHLVYTRNLHYIVPKFETNQHRYTALADLAKKTNATLSFENRLITLRDRSAYRAETDGATGTGTGNLSFDNTNKAFPTSGYLLIEKELLQYTGISSGDFTGITRSVLGTEVVSHSNNTEIVYVDAVIRNDEIQGDISLSTDLTRIYNVIRDPEDNVEVRDKVSIEKYGERPYTLNLGLTHHELAWQEHILESYLTELKDPKKLVNITLTPKNYLRAGHVIGLKYNQLVYAVRIVAITYNKTSTQIRGRTL